MYIVSVPDEFVTLVSNACFKHILHSNVKENIRRLITSYWNVLQRRQIECVLDRQFNIVI